MNKRRTAFFISDRTGITVETLGRSLLTQFDGIDFDKVRLPFTDSIDKVPEILALIDQAAARDGVRPIVFSTVVDEHVRSALAWANAMFLDLFQVFIVPLEEELGQRSTHIPGRTHGIDSGGNYQARIDAVNFAVNNDDGVSDRELQSADVILAGVSRSGKTPTCLYLALTYGIKAANYPLVPEDFGAHVLPQPLLPHRHKIFGLTIDPERLAQIRSERRPNSRYATLENCRQEVLQAERLMSVCGIPYLDTTTKSIEEIAATIMSRTQLLRRI